MASTIYLPLVIAPEPLLPARLGVQIEGAVADHISRLVPGRLYQWALRWRDHPSELHDANAEVLASYPQIITIKCTPTAYRLWPGFVGSPPAPQHYLTYAEFALQIVEQYKPVAVELYNEPDVWVGEAAYPDFYGAWVADGETMYQGGQRYGEFCAAVYPILQGKTKVLAGALMARPEMIEFLQGALDAGMQADALSFHCYIGEQDDYSKFGDCAGALHGLARLPLICTETAVLGDGSAAHQAAKAEYMRWLRSAWPWSVEAVVWYSLNADWKHSNLDGEAWEAWK